MDQLLHAAPASAGNNSISLLATMFNMDELFRNSPQTVFACVLVVAVCITLICVAPAIAHFWWRARRDELEAELKQQMLANGMSADEIERVLKTRAPEPSARRS